MQPDWLRTADFVAGEEGFLSYVYDDGDQRWPRPRYVPGTRVLGTLTVGFGETAPDVIAAHLDRDMDFAEARDLLRARLIGFYRDGVERHLTKPLPTPHMAGSLTSFAYNCGVNALPREGDGQGYTTAPGLLRALNDGRYANAAELLEASFLKRPKFDLADRRRREADWFREAWAVDGWAWFLPLVAA